MLSKDICHVCVVMTAVKDVLLVCTGHHTAQQYALHA